jgi:hypothetical protein
MAVWPQSNGDFLGVFFSGVTDNVVIGTSKGLRDRRSRECFFPRLFLVSKHHSSYQNPTLRAIYPYLSLISLLRLLYANPGLLHGCDILQSEK